MTLGVYTSRSFVDCFVMARFILTSALCSPSAIAELLVWLKRWVWACSKFTLHTMHCNMHRKQNFTVILNLCCIIIKCVCCVMERMYIYKCSVFDRTGSECMICIMMLYLIATHFVDTSVGAGWSPVHCYDGYW